MTIDSENVHYLMVPEVIIEVGPHPARPTSPSQTYLFFYDHFKIFPRTFFSSKLNPILTY